MVRSSLAFVVGLVAVAWAAANGLPPPTPGKRFVVAEHVITTEKAFPDHDFYLVTGGSPKKVAFGPKDPVKVEPAPRRGFGSRIQFVAVTKGAAEKFEEPTAFAEALRKGTVPGYAAAKARFESPTEIDAGDKSPKTTVTHVVVRIDAKEGIVFRGVDPEAPAPRGKAAPEPPGPRGGGVVAGLAVALAMGFAGVRLARRRAS